jgi:hypothetical protein
MDEGKVCPGAIWSRTVAEDLFGQGRGETGKSMGHARDVKAPVRKCEEAGEILLRKRRGEKKVFLFICMVFLSF